MIIITASDKSFEHYLQAMLVTLDRVGYYKRVIWDLGGLGDTGYDFERTFGTLPKMSPIKKKKNKAAMTALQFWTWKPDMILHVLERVVEPVAWIDADCIVTEKFPNLETQLDYREYDMAICDRRNTGVLFFAPTQASIDFLKYTVCPQAKKEIGIKDSRGDQTVYKREFRPYGPDYKSLIGQVIDHNGLRVKWLDSDIMNNTTFETEETPKIIHISGNSKWKKYDTVCRKYGIKL